MSRQDNIERIQSVALKLEKLNKDVVFVGGATVSLYADEVAADVRPTEDVDVIIEIASRYDYMLLEEDLRKLGCENDKESGIICRYNLEGIILDIMPTETKVIGFSNKWYPEGFKNAMPYALNKLAVNIFTLPYFLASKIEAYKGRGGDDLRFSSDFEDIIYVLENRRSTFEELKRTNGKIKDYLVEEWKKLLADPDFDEGIYAHLEPPTAAEQSKRIKAMLKAFVE